MRTQKKKEKDKTRRKERINQEQEGMKEPKRKKEGNGKIQRPKMYGEEKRSMLFMIAILLKKI